jgi:nucleotide-binding universal stress UspA family protein
MSVGIIVSYDGTSNDDDALALGRLLSSAGATLALAYVRHSQEFDPKREQLAQHDAERRLQQGAIWLEQPDVPQHVVLSRSTGEGLAQLAEELEASAIVFGSDYRTPPGHAEPGNTAQHLLDGGPVAVGIAYAGLRTEADASISKIAVSAPEDDSDARPTAESLASKLGASIVDSDAELIVVGSRSGGPEGRVTLSGASRAQLNRVRGSVLVVPRGKPVLF